jgi:hypothetical protein
VALTGNHVWKDARRTSFFARHRPCTTVEWGGTRERLKAKNAEFAAEFCQALDTLADKVLKEPVGEDVEVVLTRLRVLHLYSERYQEEHHDMHYLEEIFPLEMGIYFLILAALPIPSNPSPLYDAFLERLGNDVAFASLNYDLVLETIFQRNRRTWHYYALQGEKKIRNDLNAPEHLYVPPDQDPRSIPYLKLHGSFNWHYCWRCNYIHVVPNKWYGVAAFDLPRDGHGPLRVSTFGLLLCNECSSRKEMPNVKPLIIPPTRVKEYSRAPIRRQWALFELLLTQAEQVILVGTSIRDEDVLLYNSLNLLQSKNRRLKRLIIINPSRTMKRKAHILTEVKPEWYRSLKEYVADRRVS